MIQYLLMFLAVMSVILFCLMGADKSLAVKHARRVPEKVLFGFALFGGAIGGTLGMYVFRHKTKHWYFALGFPLFALLQLVGAGWLVFRM